MDHWGLRRAANPRGVRLTGLFWLVSTLTGSQAYAQDDAPDPAAADYPALIQRALAEFEAGRYPEARRSFEQAHAAQPSARTLRGLGVTAVALERYGEATDELEASLFDPRRPLTAAQRHEVTDLLDWMRSSLGTLRLELSPAHADAIVDDQRVRTAKVVLDPGAHQLSVRADGFRPATRGFSLLAGEKKSLRVELAAISAGTRSVAPTPTDLRATTVSPPRDSSPTVFERWWFWTALGVVVVGGTVAAIALSAEPEPRPYERGGLGGVLQALRVAP